jgi:cytochrome c553
MKKILSLIIMLGTVSLFAGDVAAIAKKCTACHGAQGEKSALNKSKIMKDLSKEEFIASLKGYKDGTYGGALKNLMKPQVAALSDEDIAGLADFYIK